MLSSGRLALDEPVYRLLPQAGRPAVLRRLDGPFDYTMAR